jgi:hypothetical protein
MYRLLRKLLILQYKCGSLTWVWLARDGRGYDIVAKAICGGLRLR